MLKIKLHDYFDEALGEYCGIGQGNLAAAVILRLIAKAVATKQDIEVDINSGGGLVYDGFTIYNSLIAAKATVKVTTINSGLAASIASIIFMAGDRRIMARAALFMAHKPATNLMFSGSLTSDDLKREADSLDAVQNVLLDIYTTGTVIKPEEMDAFINAETWFTPDECEVYGFSTETKGGSFQKVALMADVMEAIQAGADVRIKAYTNKFFTSIKLEEMAKENKVVAQSKKLLATARALINKALGEPENVALTLDSGTVIYADGALADGVEVYEDEAQTLPLADADYTLESGATFTVSGGVVGSLVEAAADEDEPENAANLETLTNENAALKIELEEAKAEALEATNALNQTNIMLEKLTNTASNYKPAKRAPVFNKGNQPPAAEPKFKYVPKSERIKK